MVKATNQQKHTKNKKYEKRVRVIKFLAILDIIFGALGLILGIFFLFIIRPIDTSIGIGVINEMMTAFGIIFLILSPVFIVLGWGLRNLKNWARIGVMVTFFLLYVSVLILFFYLKKGGFHDIATMLLLTIGVFYVYHYFSQPSTKSIFK